MNTKSLDVALIDAQEQACALDYVEQAYLGLLTEKLVMVLLSQCVPDKNMQQILLQASHAAAVRGLQGQSEVAAISELGVNVEQHCGTVLERLSKRLMSMPVKFPFSRLKAVG